MTDLIKRIEEALALDDEANEYISKLMAGVAPDEPFQLSAENVPVVPDIAALLREALAELKGRCA